jgi:hypothetical protein
MPTSTIVNMEQARNFPVTSGKFKPIEVVLGGLVISVLATGHGVRKFKPSRGRRIFKSDRVSDEITSYL